jgi:carbon-monoxide dehydrogenase small subunit
MDGRSITTIEGLSDRGKLHPLQEAFIAEGAIQCGFCTPGMILAAKALLDRNPDPTMEEIRNALRGNFCRCTGYVNIFNAVRKAAETMARSKT